MLLVQYVNFERLTVALVAGTDEHVGESEAELSPSISSPYQLWREAGRRVLPQLSRVRIKPVAEQTESPRFYESSAIEKRKPP